MKEMLQLFETISTQHQCAPQNRFKRVTFVSSNWLFLEEKA